MLICLLSAPASDYGLFLSDEDPRKGIWLESGRTLDYYMLRNGVNTSTCVTHTLKQPMNDGCHGAIVYPELWQRLT